MRAKEFINEIGHAHELGGLNVDIEQLLPVSELIGNIDHSPVYRYALENQELFFLLLNGQPAAMTLIVDHTDIRAIKSMIQKGGIITALLSFVVRQLGRKLRIRSDEALTADGFNWLYHIIKSGGRGLTFSNAKGSPIDIKSLDDEWKNARLFDTNGPTEIMIEGHPIQIPNINEGLLILKYRYIGDTENL